MALRLRRGTNADRLTITPEAGEILYTTDTKKLFVGDGSTVGGNLVSGVNDIIDDATPQLGGDLDLNGNDIIGNGNINISGTITATGNINLGDGAGGDVITLAGEVSGSLQPTADESFDIGSASKRWRTIYASGLQIDGQIDAAAFNSNLIADDSTISYDSGTGDFVGDLSGNVTGDLLGNSTGYHTGDVSGSVFANNSTLLVDGVSGTIPGENISGTITSGVTFEGLVPGSSITGTIGPDVTLIGSFQGNSNGYHTGDVTGSVFAIDSSVLVDGISGQLFATEVRTPRVKNPSGNLRMVADAGNVTVTAPAGTLELSANDTITIDNTTTDITITANTDLALASTTTNIRLDAPLIQQTSTANIDINASTNINLDSATADIQLTAASGTVRTSKTVQLASTDANGALQLQRTESSGAVGDTTSIGRITFTTVDTGGTNTPFQIDASPTYINIFPVDGAADYTKFFQVYKNGKVQIGGEAGGSGFDGLVREPVSTLEVYGDATIGDILIEQNNITTTDSNANLKLGASGTGTIELDVPTQTTVGAAGAASALPATPSTYFKINVGGTEYVVPAYAVS
jgi:hypothetical protein